jgi:hypothetical protein
MRAVLAIVTLAIVLVFVGGFGFITARILDAEWAVLAFGYVLYGAIAVTLASLSAAIVVGVWHLYLYLFTRKKPVSLFAATSRDES